MFHCQLIKLFESYQTKACSFSFQLLSDFQIIRSTFYKFLQVDSMCLLDVSKQISFFFFSFTCRLFGDTTFSDILFIVRNVEFQAHSVVLRARAPNFCRHFLPRHASPVSVQTCIQINGLEAAEFEAFLRYWRCFLTSLVNKHVSGFRSC